MQRRSVGSFPLIEFFILFFISLGVLHEIAAMDSIWWAENLGKGNSYARHKRAPGIIFYSNPFY